MKRDLSIMNKQKKLGQYYTKPIIVEAMLDMIGYKSSTKLYEKKLLEPSAGDGGFLFLAIERLVKSVEIDYSSDILGENNEIIINILKNSLRVIELNPATYDDLKKEVHDYLVKIGFSEINSRKLVDKWIINEDFLMWNVGMKERFDFIIGNPPYIRIENILPETLKIYKSNFKTLFDRADIYVAFIEHSLKMLSKSGTLSFICTDRFTKNNYGKIIRNLISDSFRVKYYIDIHNTMPYMDEVSSYPCIFGIDRKLGGESLYLNSESIQEEEVQEMVDYVLYRCAPIKIVAEVLEKWFENDQPWIMDFEVNKILKKIQEFHPSIKQLPEAVKCKVGVASGLNAVFLVSKETILTNSLEIELLVPIITKNHIRKGLVDWDGLHLINTYDINNKPVDINEFPNIQKYLLSYKEKLENRAFVKKKPHKWYFTQEKIRLNELSLPKLLFPDITQGSRIIIEKGNYYPEHSLYYLISNNYDINFLKIIMESPIGLSFVRAHSTKMRGDYIRFQKQSVVNVCLPCNISPQLEKKILEADKLGDVSKLHLLLQQAYSLESEEMEILKNFTMQVNKE